MCFVNEPWYFCNTHPRETVGKVVFALKADILEEIITNYDYPAITWLLLFNLGRREQAGAFCHSGGSCALPMKLLTQYFMSICQLYQTARQENFWSLTMSLFLPRTLLWLCLLDPFTNDAKIYKEAGLMATTWLHTNIHPSPFCLSENIHLYRDSHNQMNGEERQCLQRILKLKL